MLRFIVLGEIPGTHLVITFTWVLALASVLLSIGELTIIIARYKRQHKSASVLPKITQKQAGYFGRIIGALPANTVFPVINRLVQKVRSNA